MAIDNALDDPNMDEDMISPDERRPARLLDTRRQADGELSDSDDEGEGGRRNHARHRDRSPSSDSGSPSARKFGIGVGIMSSGQAASALHGAGPSGHTTAARILSATTSAGARMDIDDSPTTSENGNGEADKGADLAVELFMEETKPEIPK
jgi:histone deacetylase 1/2